MTATLEQTRPITTDKYGLALHVECELQPKVASIYDDYLTDSQTFLLDENTLHEKWTDLTTSTNITIGGARDMGAELRERRLPLEEILARLKYRRVELVYLVEPDFVTWDKTKAAEFEQGTTAEMDNLKLIGFDRSLPGYGNPRVRDHQLRKHAEKSEGVAILKGEAMQAKDQLRVLRSQVGTLPSFESCRIRWQGAVGLQLQIAQLAGVASDSDRAPIQASGRLRFVLLQLGFEGAALLPEHVDTFNAIADLVVHAHSQPLSQVKRGELEAVRKLVGQLPRTREVRTWLDATAAGPIHHPV